MLSTEQQNLLELLSPGYYSWVALDLHQQLLLAETLRPVGGFSDEQKELLADWYLLISSENVAAANNTLASLNCGVSPRQTIDERIVVNADLLTDCMRPGDTYHAIAPLLATLKLIRLSADNFPAPFEGLP